MRLWSLHPKHLDPQGLVALWREGLLARAVLHEQTRGYRNHPQLERFKAHAQPKRAIDAYLAALPAGKAPRILASRTAFIADSQEYALQVAAPGLRQQAAAHPAEPQLRRRPRPFPHPVVAQDARPTPRR